MFLKKDVCQHFVASKLANVILFMYFCYKFLYFEYKTTFASFGFNFN